MTPQAQLVPFNQLWNLLGGSFRNGDPIAFYISKQESIFNLTKIRRYFIRLVHFKCKWSSNYSKHSCAIFITKEEARQAAKIAADESGEMYCVKELPINKMLPHEAVNFGFQEFFHSDINTKYQSRTLDVVNMNEMEMNLKLGRRVVETLKSAMP